jgi:hypothetical protein
VKSNLRLLALAIIIGALGYWMAMGANRGWTKNQVPIKTLDDVTGIEGVTYQKKFVPGVEFLAGAAVAGCLCFGLSFLFRTKPALQSSNQQTPINK